MGFIQYLKTHPISESDHSEMLPTGRLRSSEGINEAHKVQKAAVGIHSYITDNGELAILLIKRSEYEGKHSGQIAFPGGKNDIHDTDLEYTARRECYEELGIPMDQGELVRTLTPVYIPVSNFQMFPFVFFHSIRPVLHKNEREVNEIMELSIEELAYGLPISHKTVALEKNSLYSRNVPGFEFNGHWIWGATALVLNQIKIAYASWNQKSR